MGSRRQARILAFQSLFSQDLNPQSIEKLLTLDWMEAQERQDLEPDVLFFTRFLISGTIEHWDELNVAIEGQLRNWDFNRVGKVDLGILRISAFQMLFVKDIPVKVVIDEAIDIAKRFASDDSYRFINGVLDGLRKEKGL
ncbi:MAG: transcription antitermination factor NusB [Spirochaetales bacterium]